MEEAHEGEARLARVVPMKRPRVFSYHSDEWKRARAAALLRALYRCEWCKRSVAGFRQSRVDHIVPVRENPALALDSRNLRVLCPECDNRRHAEKGHPRLERTRIGLDGFPE